MSFIRPVNCEERLLPETHLLGMRGAVWVRVVLTSPFSFQTILWAITAALSLQVSAVHPPPAAARPAPEMLGEINLFGHSVQLRPPFQACYRKGESHFSSFYQLRGTG